jgi:pyruvate/2-oxoglutarate/acetoin dehydrogenase E1 component
MGTVLQALNQGLRRCLETSSEVILLGEDILDPYGGAFKVVRGLSTDFPDRVVTTPVSEAGIVGVGVGMALQGLRPVVEIMFGDFLTLAADQLINHAAKFRWMSNNQVCVPLVVRTPMGGYRGYGPTHSQSLEKLFLGVPGLRVLAANSLMDPEGVLCEAVLEDDDPVLLIEHKLLYPQELFSAGDEFVIEQKGGRYPWTILRIAGAPRVDMTLTAYGYMAELAREALILLAYEHEIFAEMAVPVQLSPFELDPLMESARYSGKVLAVEEGSLNLGWSAEVAARIVEALGAGTRFRRVAARNLPIPAAPSLEAAILPQVEDILQSALALVQDQSSG